MFKRIGHTAFTVENMENSLHFYCDVLGIKKVFELKEPNTGAPWIVYLKVTDGQFIELFYGGNKKNQWDSSTIGYNHICLEVENIQEIANSIKSKGATLDSEPKQGIDFNWQCWISDPDGNRIEFMQLDPKSPHMNC
ncbi:MAG TPA: VOC family protein [Ruminiclostridium sp.]